MNKSTWRVLFKLEFFQPLSNHKGGLAQEEITIVRDHVESLSLNEFKCTLDKHVWDGFDRNDPALGKGWLDQMPFQSYFSMI